jgi:hypothetical protein
MNTLHQSLLLAVGALALAGTAYAQVPASNDTSDGNYNTGMGTGALHGPAASNGGLYNTATGYEALYANTTGGGNTAYGAVALPNNTTGSNNTASGADTLFTNSTGGSNTASGAYALFSNTTGSNNTASGMNALINNTIGANNTASGMNALANDDGGNDNTASGYEALYANMSGNYNNASGYFALHNNSSGSQNSASGVQALYGNKTGNYNTASGTDALYSNTSGSTNIAEGYKAGYNLTTGSNNIDVGNLGVAAESGTIRIGTSSTVVVSSTGQLGVTVSSERYKTSIAPMGSDTTKLGQLRPVSFKLKSDATGTRQYGLIAEEVAKVYPELVIRDRDGRIDGVRYEELAPMLLNEVQKLTAAQGKQNAAQAAQIRELKQQVAEMHAALLKVTGQSEHVAQR